MHRYINLRQNQDKIVDSFGCNFLIGFSNIPSSDCNIEVLASNASWCEEHVDDVDLQHICDGTKKDCITNAESLCKGESSCVGFMWNDGWGSHFKGVKKCTSTKLIAKSSNDWETYLKKCKTGIGSMEIVD